MSSFFNKKCAEAREFSPVPQFIFISLLLLPAFMLLALLALSFLPAKTKSTSLLDHFSCTRVKNHPVGDLERIAVKVKHIVDRASQRIEAAFPNPLAAQPVVFNKAKHRALVGYRVIYKVTPSPW
jgi:hypothetical protein